MTLTRECLCPVVLTRASDQAPLSTRYEQRYDEANIRAYGRAVVELAGVVPDGMVVFFVSYRCVGVECGWVCRGVCVVGGCAWVGARGWVRVRVLGAASKSSARAQESIAAVPPPRSRPHARRPSSHT